MPRRTSHRRLVHLPTNLPSPQNLPLVPSLLRLEVARGDLMSRLEVLSPRGAAEEVCFDWVAEGEGFGRLSAEQHHVGVVRRRWGSGRCFRFAVQTALWEDGFYGADDGGGDGEKQVAGIVLVFVS